MGCAPNMGRGAGGCTPNQVHICPTLSGAHLAYSPEAPSVKNRHGGFKSRPGAACFGCGGPQRVGKPRSRGLCSPTRAPGPGEKAASNVHRTGSDCKGRPVSMASVDIRLMTQRKQPVSERSGAHLLSPDVTAELVDVHEAEAASPASNPRQRQRPAHTAQPVAPGPPPIAECRRQKQDCYGCISPLHTEARTKIHLQVTKDLEACRAPDTVSRACLVCPPS